MMLLRAGIGVWMLAVGWWLWGIAVAYAFVPAASISVAADDGEELLSVTARAVPLQTLLSEVGRHAGFQITGMVPTGRQVSVEFTRLPLDQALRRLLSGENFIFIYNQPAAGGAVKLSRIILVGSSLPQPGGSTARPAVAHSDGADVVPATAEPIHTSLKDTQAVDPDGPLEQLLPLTAHPDLKTRMAALTALTRHAEDDLARQTLMDHSRDPDPNVRSVALHLLGPFVIQWPGAEDVVMTALQDSDPSVRRLALDVMWGAASPRLPDALQLALQDENPELRHMAGELLRSASLVVADPNAADPTPDTADSPSSLTSSPSEGR